MAEDEATSSEKITSGSEVFDTLLGGGFEKDVITTIYGPAASGKTTTCLLCAAAMKDKKVIYVDTEGGFSVERLSQLTPDYKNVIKRLFLLKPTNFEDQKKAVERLNKMVNDKIGLIVIDTISMLYRAEFYNKEGIPDMNRVLGKQVSSLIEIARKHSIPILITNQVYSNFEDKNTTNMVGGDILKYGSKCIVELQFTPDKRRFAVLRKHRNIPEQKVYFDIKSDGLYISKQEGKEKKFKLF